MSDSQINSASGDANLKQLYVHTPVIDSYALSKILHCTVHLKLENCQPNGSFKIRGLGHIIQKKMQMGCTHLVASSGGNAGLAAAYAAKRLSIPITIIVPESTPVFMRQRLKGEGANLVVHGAVWDKADAKAQELAQDPECAYIPPFDHPDIWEGHESLIQELAADLDITPDLVVVSVGGGGLLCGVVQGMEKVGWKDVPILAMETVGADSFNQAVKAGKLVTLPDITSVAKCLGALTVASQALEYYNTRPIFSEVITDKECIDACFEFLDDQRIMVEPACAASLAAIYSGTIKRLQQQKKLAWTIKHVVVIVCGGCCVNMMQLMQWKSQVE